MNKFYSNSINSKSRFKQKLLLLFLIIGISITTRAQVLVTSTGGVVVPTNYLTLKAAFDAINAGTHQDVITISVTGSPVETATAVLNSSSGSSSYTSITITPSGPGKLISGNLATGLVKLNGADNVTIDGGPSKDLSFSNSSTSASSGVIWVASATVSDGASNNAIKNCIVTGGGATTMGAAISQSSGVTFGGLAETANSNNSYINNTVTAALYGFKMAGATGNEDQNTIISGNIVNTNGHAGIYAQMQNNVLISKNTISAVSTASGGLTFQTSGIIVIGSIIGGSIEKNKIFNIRVNSVWGCNGIQLDATNTNTGLLIANNFIYDIASGGFGSFDSVDDNATGIAVNKGGGYKIHYNSIDMGTNFTGTSTTYKSSAIWISGSIAANSLVITNNIFSNRITVANRFSIYSNAANTVFNSINSNDYYSSGSVGFLGSIQGTLANWQVASLQDDASVAVNPFFTNSTDLHLLGNSPLDALAVPVPGITGDIDPADVRNATTPDIGADEFTPPNCTNPVIDGFPASASVTEICASGTATLTASGYSFGVGIAYQWQYSLTGTSGPWTNLGQTNPLTATTGTINTTHYYHLMVTCNNITVGYSVPITIIVNNPAVTGGPDVARCGIGTVDLTATGNNLQWYAASTGGSVLGTGSPFTTPLITSTTSFYVSAATAGISGTGGKPAPVGTTGYNGLTGLIFDATQPFTLLSVRMYPMAAGAQVIIQAVNSAGAQLPGCSQTVTFGAVSPTGYQVDLFFPIPIGTNHRLVLTQNLNNTSFRRDFNPGNNYPYILAGVGSITSGYISGVSTAYYYFFDWHFTTRCESLRAEVKAIVNDPPALTTVSPAAGAPRTICTGSSVTLDATGGGYTSYVWNPGALPNGSVVSPTTTTTYSLTASTPDPGGCRRDSAVTIIVNQTPTPLTITPPSVSICPNLAYQVTTSGGLISGQTVFSEFGEIFPMTQFTLAGSGVNVSQNATYYQQGSKSIHLTHGASANGSIVTGNIPLTGFTAPSLTFWHIAGLEASATSHWDVGYVEYSTDGGTVWTKFPVGSYGGTGTLHNQINDATPPGIGFDNTSYPDWDGQFTGSASSPGGGPATALWKQETINLAAWQGLPNFKIRFRILADAIINYYGWLIDNIRITATGQAPVTWNNTANLWATNLHNPVPPVVANSGNWPAPWYWVAGNTGAITYTATATGGVGCTTSATVTISATSAAPDVTIAASPAGPICAGTPVTFTATPVNAGAGAAYNWKVNGVSLFGSQVGLTSIILTNLTAGANVRCEMSVVPNFCNPGGLIDTSNTIGPYVVNPLPIANNITGSTGTTVCTGTPNILNQSAAGISTYQWFESVTNPVGTNSSSYSATLPGSYTVIVSTAAGCKDTSAPFVVTLPTNTITATAGPNGTIDPIGAVIVGCGNDTTFDIIPNPGYSIFDVLVNGVSVGAVPSYTFNNVTGDSTIHAIFYLMGCGSPHTSNAGPNASMCSGPNFTLSGTRSIGGGALTGTWTTSGDGTFIPDNTFANATSYMPGINDINAGTVDLTLTTNTPALPCLPSSSSMTLTLKRSPSVTMGGLIGICTVGATTTHLVADTSATAENITGIQWYNPALIPGATNDSLFVSSTGAYSVTVTGSNGCTAGATGNVNVFAPPTVVLTGGGAICTDAGVDINATTTAGSGTEDPNGYQWYIGGVLIPGAITSVLTATTAGNYTALATNSNGCVSTVISNTISLAVDNSPLNGDYTIGLGPASCTNYISFAAAVKDLNNRSISGNVRFSVQGGYTETVPSPGLVLGKPALNAATASGFTISFFKSTAGANPLLTAFTGGAGTPATAIPDGIFKLRGVDNVSILEIDLAENAANSGNSLMDFGYGLFRYTATDGAQNNTIQGCTITLNKTNSTAAGGSMSEGATGILVLNAVDTNAITQIVPTSVPGTNSYNKFYGNTIKDCHNGIWLGGYNAPTPYTLGDTGNDIGGIASGTGNIITNFGYTGDLTAPNGIRIVNQWSVNAQFNSIDNNDGGGVNTTNSLNGIVGVGGTSANATISNNTISLKSSATGGQSVFGIDNGIGSTAASNTITINANTITGSSLLATNAQWIGIRNSATAATVTISGNTVQNVTLAGNGASSIFYGINNAVTVPVINVNNNIIRGNTKLATGNMFGISLSTPTLANINNNVVSNNTINGGAAACTMNCIISAGAVGASYTLDGNTIYNNSITNMAVGNIGTVFGYSNIGSPGTEIITDNIVRKLFVTGAAGSTAVHVIRGIYNNTTGTTNRTCSRNQVDSLYTNAAASGAIVGIYSQAGGAVVMGLNKIHSLLPGQQGAGVAFAKGILIAGGNTSVKCYNNAISLDLTQAFAPAGNNVLNGTNAVAGIELNTAAAGAFSIYYNTVRLAGAGSGTAFGSSGISLVSTTGSADLRDNLIMNIMTPGGGAGSYTTALRRTLVALTGYALTSNNNLWYTTQTATTPLYYDGTGTFPTLALFKTNVSTRETFSIDDLPIFVNTALNNLHLSPANNCNIDGAGAPIPAYSSDYDSQVRNASLPDIGMDEFNGTGTGFTWKGYNTDWMNASNWCGGVPTAASDVIIPAGKNFYPNIVTAAPVAHNITINTGGSITIAAAGTLSNTGSWTNDGTLTNNGTIVLNGTVNQSFPGAGAGTIPAMNNLTVNNPGGATINKHITLTGNLEPTLGNIAVNDTITLHSDASGTASVDTVLGSFTYNGVGKFVVERFISTNNIGPAFYVGWRYLAAPITGTQTINQAWQEGQTPGVYVGTGYGTQIIGPGGTAVGFDLATTLPSLKKYDPVTNTYVGVPGTLSPNFISATDGYMIFVRGDRAANALGDHNATTLRMAGPIKTGPVTLSTVTPNQANQFIAVGNPYPCAISFTSMGKTNLQDFYYIWDPKVGLYGAWQTFTGPGYNPSTLGGSYVNGQSNIESGMAFMVKANALTAPHSIQINESCKRVGSFSVARVNGIDKQFRTRLLAVNNPMIYDGNRVDFDPAYSNVVDDNDAEKLNNFGENLGLVRDGKSIVVERRAEIVDTDTIFFKMGHVKVQDYQLEFTAENLASPVLTAYLEDAFLNSRTQISLDAVTTVNFTVTADPLSKAADRFRIVFKQQGIVPLSFISVKAFRQENNIMVNWSVVNEMNIAQYEIQHSADGRNFSQLGTQAARNINGAGSQEYNLLDVQPYSGDNFYRIKSVNNSGEIKYSDIVKVNMKGDPSMITVYPNPVKDGMIRLEFTNQPKADYEVKLYGTNSQLIMKQHVDHPGGNQKLTIPVQESIAKGVYTLEIILPKGKKQVFKLVIE